MRRSTPRLFGLRVQGLKGFRVLEFRVEVSICFWFRVQGLGILGGSSGCWGSGF